VKVNFPVVMFPLVKMKFARLTRASDASVLSFVSRRLSCYLVKAIIKARFHVFSRTLRAKLVDYIKHAKSQN